jgi:hypothetical protein
MIEPGLARHRRQHPKAAASPEPTPRKAKPFQQALMAFNTCFFIALWLLVLNIIKSTYGPDNGLNNGVNCANLILQNTFKITRPNKKLDRVSFVIYCKSAN